MLFLVFIGYQAVKMSNENKENSLDKATIKILQDINYKAFFNTYNISKNLAKNKSIKELCLENNNLNYNNTKLILNTIQETSSLELCYVMNLSGTVVASNNDSINNKINIEGQNFNFRSYFLGALEGNSVIYPALGSTTMTRGVYFSSPIKDDANNILGVLVCKINMDKIDSILKEYNYDSLIATSDGIIFSSNRKDWLFNSISPISNEKLKEILKSKQFSNLSIKPLDLDLEKHYLSEKPIGDTGWKLLTLSNKNITPSLTPIQIGFITIISFILFILIITIELLIHAIFMRNESNLNFIKLFQAVEQASTTVVITDVMGVIEYVNPMFSKLTGYTLQESIGESTNILNSGKHTDEFYNEMWSTILSGKDWRGNFCNKRKNGEIYWEDALISSVKNSKGEITNFIAVKEDITKRKELDELLNVYATMDEMTGTYNRRSCLLLLDKQLQCSIRENQCFVILFMDINGLKSVNDSLGHSFGDELIISAVAILKNSLRTSDSICRLGGDEFLVILPNTTLLQSEMFLKRFEEKTKELNSENKYPFILSSSFGAAEYSPESNLTIDNLLQIADEKMYQNKSKIKQVQGAKGIFR